MTDKRGGDNKSQGPKSSLDSDNGSSAPQGLASDFVDSLPKGNDPLIKPSRTSFMSRLRSNFFAGVVIAAPFGITAWLIWLLFSGPLSNVDKFVKKWFPNSGNQFFDAFLINFPFIGVVIAILCLVFLGALTRNFIGSSIIKAWERLVDSVPVVRNLYRFFKNVFETALQQSDRSFKEVAMVQYPMEGLWAMSFVVGEAKGEVRDRLDDMGEDLVSIFVPTVPNPTSGFLLFVPRKSLRVLDMTVEEAAKVVFSMGLVVPEQNPDAAIERLEKLASEAKKRESEKGSKELSGQSSEDVDGEGSPEKKTRKKRWLGGDKQAG